MAAIREDKSGKPDWELFLSSFKGSLEQLCHARSYSVKRHTDPVRGIDGRTNWAENMGTSGHEAWVRTCLSSASRHIVDRIAGSRNEPDQNNLMNLAFAVQNLLMVMEYDLFEDREKTDNAR